MRGWNWTQRDGPHRSSLSFLRDHRAIAAYGLCLTSIVCAGRAGAQLFARPWLQWQTVHAGRFDVHYPAELSAWAQFVAERMPGIDSAVTKLVGYSPPTRVHIVVEDPFDVSNGFAFTLLDKPVIVFWASPPDPRESIGQFRTWGEMLAVHEFGHVAHLTRPSRNPLFRTLWRISPVDLGPIALRSPRWAIEGYATYIEGVVTGSGRPHGVWRPAVLRQWAIEGRLPNYEQLSSWNDFAGGEFAYLAGSAFLEWLARRNGDSSLVDLWRRLSARVNRSFDDAFAGVYGDPPAIVYDRFRAEVTAGAVDLDSALAHDGVVEGELVQHLRRATGDPALSPDGKRVALVVRTAGRPSRVVVWSTAAEPDTAERKARERLLARDSLDVPARRVYPAPKRALATLVSRDGRSFEDPRWFADGNRILLWRPTRRPDGALRPELYVWDLARHSVRRLTSQSNVRDADPSPNGGRAVAVSCPGGHCSVVVVNLVTAATRVLASGDVLTSFARPRWSPDGRTIAVAMQRENRWRLALIDSAGSAPRVVDPDDGANRFDPSWLGPTSLVLVSDRSGAPNLERIEFGDAGTMPLARPLTRLVGAAIAPEPNRADGSIWFLSMHSQGYDVRRIASSAAIADTAPLLLESRITPITIARSTSVHAFSPSLMSPARSYGIGPRTTRWIPGAEITADGQAMTFALVNSDFVGRLTMLGQGSVGSGDAWRGASVDAVWRASRPDARLALFTATTTDADFGVPTSTPLAERTDALRGARSRTDYSRAFDRGDLRFGLGGSIGWIDSRFGTVSSRLTRNLGFFELSGSARQNNERSSANESFFINLSAGTTDGGSSYRRFLSTVRLQSASERTLPIDASGTYGVATSGAASYEQFEIGGPPSNLVDASLLTQRIPIGALPAGALSGDRAIVYRVSTSLAGISPYYWSGNARSGSGRFSHWQQVIGVDVTLDQTPVPVLGLPGARLVAGIGESLDTPFARRIRGYMTVLLRP